MENEDKILQALDNYYSTASKEELRESFEKANKLCSSGITWEEYIENLNKSTSIIYEN
jgi:hypothetical protein